MGCAEAGRRRGLAGGVRAETRPRARGPPAEPAPAGPPGACPAPRPLLPPEAPRRGCVGHQGLLALAPRPWCLVLPQGPVSPPLAQRGYRETPLGPRDPPSAAGWPQGTGSGPLCHALAPVPGLLGELNVLRSPSPRPRSRSRPPFSERGQRQVLDAGTRGMLQGPHRSTLPAGRRIPDSARQAFTQLFHPKCKREQFAGLKKKSGS